MFCKKFCLELNEKVVLKKDSIICVRLTDHSNLVS